MQSVTDRSEDAGAPKTRARGVSRSRRRAIAWSRKAATLALLAAPLAAVLTMDVSRRGPRVAEFRGYYAETYAAAMLESFVLWGTLLYAASRRRGSARHVVATFFVVAFTLAVGGQRYFHDQYNAYLNVDVSLFASNLMDSVLNQLFADIKNYLIAKMPPLCFAIAIVW